MDWFSFIPLVIVALGFTSMQVESLKDRLRCPVRVLKGGRVRIRSRGRVAKYVCLRGYQVLGDKYSTCVRGKWDTPVPICINSGCLSIDVPHGQVLETYRGAFVTVHCDPGHSLVGSQSLYCNGAVWNDTAPTCREVAVSAQKWCDFETEDLCGWTHDLNHDFNWIRHNFATPSGHIGTGPSYDHTFGPGLNGHYMYLETSSPRLENDTARLFSPVFNAVNKTPTCFIFWYHMFGLSTGTLNVYLHIQDTTVLFSKSGDQGNQWLRAVVPLPPVSVSFQIVIEGVRGAGYEGDIAIDDVKLTEGGECVESTVTNDEEITTEVTVASETDSSCENRCFIAVTDPSLCECTADCISNNTCCPDYMRKCTLGVSAITGGAEVSTEKFISSSQTTTARPTTSTSMLDIISTESVALPHNSTERPVPSYTLPSNKSGDVGPSRTLQPNNTSTVSAVTNKSLPSSSNATITITFPATTQVPKTTSTLSIGKEDGKVSVTNLLMTTKLLISSPKPSTTDKVNRLGSISSSTVTTLTPPVKTSPSSTRSVAKQTTVLPQWKPYSVPTKKWVPPSKPKIEFVTPPPPIAFRTPAKPYKPFTKYTNAPITNFPTTRISTTRSTTTHSPTIRIPTTRYTTTHSLTTRIPTTRATTTHSPTTRIPTTRYTTTHSLTTRITTTRATTTHSLTTRIPTTRSTTTHSLTTRIPTTRSTTTHSPTTSIPTFYSPTTHFPTTTQNPKKLFNKTQKIPMSKNEVLHPFWSKDPQMNPIQPPLGPNPGVLTNQTSTITNHSTTAPASTTLNAQQRTSVMLTSETKWKSKYKPREEPTVHAQFAVSSTPSKEIVHIIVLVAGVLLILSIALVTVCVVRKRRINRSRSEDDELDIRFLASDEILDFTLARPSMDEFQLLERR